MVVVMASVLAVAQSGSDATDSATGVPKRTVGRWLTWWRTVFVATALFVGEGRSRLVPPVDTARLPASLLERFVATDRDRQLGLLLRFVSPVTTVSVGDGARIARVDG